VRTGATATVAWSQSLERPTDVDCSPLIDFPVVGTGSLRQLSGVIFDWRGHRFGVVTGRTAGVTHPHWVEIEMLRMSVDDRAPAGQGFRANLPLVFVMLGGTRRVAMLDSCFAGDISSTGVVPPRRPYRRVTAETFGLTSPALLGHASEVLELDGINLEGLSLLAYEGRRRPRPSSITIGLGVLRQFPFWIDYDEGVVRLWVGDGPLRL